MITIIHGSFCSGKTTLAMALQTANNRRGIATALIDDFDAGEWGHTTLEACKRMARSNDDLIIVCLFNCTLPTLLSRLKRIGIAPDKIIKTTTHKRI